MCVYIYIFSHALDKSSGGLRVSGAAEHCTRQSRMPGGPPATRSHQEKVGGGTKNEKRQGKSAEREKRAGRRERRERRPLKGEGITDAGMSHRDAPNLRPEQRSRAEFGMHPAPIVEPDSSVDQNGRSEGRARVFGARGQKEEGERGQEGKVQTQPTTSLDHRGAGGPVLN